MPRLIFDILILDPKIYSRYVINDGVIAVDYTFLLEGKTDHLKGATKLK